MKIGLTDRAKTSFRYLMSDGEDLLMESGVEAYTQTQDEIIEAERIVVGYTWVLVF